MCALALSHCTPRTRGLRLPPHILLSPQDTGKHVANFSSTSGVSTLALSITTVHLLDVDKDNTYLCATHRKTHLIWLWETTNTPFALHALDTWPQQKALLTWTGAGLDVVWLLMANGSLTCFHSFLKHVGTALQKALRYGMVAGMGRHGPAFHLCPLCGLLSSLSGYLLPHVPQPLALHQHRQHGACCQHTCAIFSSHRPILCLPLFLEETMSYGKDFFSTVPCGILGTLPALPPCLPSPTLRIPLWAENRRIAGGAAIS